MGLDITAYSNLKFLRGKEGDHYDGYIHVYQDSSFPDHCELEEGYYDETSKTRTHTFRAGSYSGYNEFRNILAQCTLGVTTDVVWEDDSYETRPFYKIINFSDCHGSIGPKYSADLYREFVDNRDRFIRNLKQEIDFTKETENPLALEPEFILDLNLDQGDIEYYIGVYDNLTRAFELAKDDGLVEFH
jgi:hypothetical protein